jgi:prevent-host-death family protein
MVTNIHEAKTHLSRLVDRAAAGEEIVIAKAGKPMAKLVPFQKAPPKRKLGAGRARSGWLRSSMSFHRTFWLRSTKARNYESLVGFPCSVMGAGWQRKANEERPRCNSPSPGSICERSISLGARDKSGLGKITNARRLVTGSTKERIPSSSGHYCTRHGRGQAPAAPQGSI